MWYNRSVDTCFHRQLESLYCGIKINKLQNKNTIGGRLMQLFLAKPFRQQVSPYVDAVFTGTELQLFFKGSPITVCDAKPGESYYVVPHGQSKYPQMEKAKMPDTRGKKIAWALSFVESKKHADSYEDFLARFEGIAADYDSQGEKFCEFKPGAFAFMVVPKRVQPGKGRGRIGKMKPLFIWVSDDISESDLDQLIGTYRKYHSIFCGEDFIKVL